MDKKTYLRSVSKLLDCPKKVKNQLMRRLDSAVTAYLEDATDADNVSLEKNFGTPAECAARLMDEFDPALIASVRKRKIGRVWIVVAVLLVVLIAVVCIAAYIISRNGYAVIIKDYTVGEVEKNTVHIWYNEPTEENGE